MIFATCLLLLLLILERLWFVRITWPARAACCVAEWQHRDDRISWRAQKIREAMISEVRLELHAMLPFIQLLVALCPLLGLLGTVVGMIEIFGSQAPGASAGANPQQLAHGISVALYNTAFGLMVAIPALIFWRYFRGRVDAYLLTLELSAGRLARHLKAVRK